jgi:hypothetical protein
LLIETARLMVHTDVAMEVTTDAVQLFGAFVDLGDLGVAQVASYRKVGGVAQVQRMVTERDS